MDGPEATPPSAEQLAELASLDAVLEQLDAVRAEAARSPTFGFDRPWPVFLRLMRLLNPQSYGARIQNRLALHHGWRSVPASWDRGDVVDGNGRFWEVKVSVVTATSHGVNFVQIRPHQDISGYHCFVVDESYTITHLTLTKREMDQELERLGSSAHGTVSAVAGNLTKEYAIRFPWTPGTGVAGEWVERYGQAAPAPGGPVSIRAHPAPTHPVQPALPFDGL